MKTLTGTPLFSTVSSPESGDDRDATLSIEPGLQALTNQTEYLDRINTRVLDYTSELPDSGVLGRKAFLSSDAAGVIRYDDGSAWPYGAISDDDGKGWRPIENSFLYDYGYATSYVEDTSRHINSGAYVEWGMTAIQGASNRISGFFAPIGGSLRSLEVSVVNELIAITTASTSQLFAGVWLLQTSGANTPKAVAFMIGRKHNTGRRLLVQKWSSLGTPAAPGGTLDSSTEYILPSISDNVILGISNPSSNTVTMAVGYGPSVRPATYSNTKWINISSGAEAYFDGTISSIGVCQYSVLSEGDRNLSVFTHYRTK